MKKIILVVLIFAMSFGSFGFTEFTKWFNSTDEYKFDIALAVFRGMRNGITLTAFRFDLEGGQNIADSFLNNGDIIGSIDFIEDNYQELSTYGHEIIPFIPEIIIERYFQYKPYLDYQVSQGNLPARDLRGVLLDFIIDPPESFN